MVSHDEDRSVFLTVLEARLREANADLETIERAAETLDVGPALDRLEAQLDDLRDRVDRLDEGGDDERSLRRAARDRLSSLVSGIVEVKEALESPANGDH